MNQTMHPVVPSVPRSAGRAARGFTLIELMISLTLGLLVLAAISTILVNTGKANREQMALARMQENGRFALSRISADLRMAGAQYCSSFSTEVGSVTQGHKLRPLRVLAGGTLPWGTPNGNPAPAAGQAGMLSPRFFIQGHECTTLATCSPVLNVLGGAIPVPPNAGTAVDQRARAADVLTVRYIAGNGAALTSAYPNPGLALTADSVVTGPPLNFEAGDLAMVTDCVNSEVFAANVSGMTITPAGNPGTNNTLKSYNLPLDPRVFNFTKDLWTVSYFLQMRANADGGSNISTLVRQQNGTPQSISDGVERMEFLYEVRAVDALGVATRHFLTAAQVQAGQSASGAALTCLPQPKGVAAQELGCLWRQVESIDVSLLLNTVTDVASNPAVPFSYSAAIPPLVEAAPPATLPSGLARGRMYRKEFRTRVNVRNFTY